MRNLISRIAALEARVTNGRGSEYVAAMLPDGALAPRRPGAMLTRHVAVMPAVCATAQEWADIYCAGQ